MGSAIGLLLLLSACGTSGPGFLRPTQAEYVLRSRGVAKIVVPYHVSNEMRRWLGKVDIAGSDQDRLRNLAEKLIDDRAIDYSRDYTGTAEEVFAAGQANCLSFTHLFVGMARELNVPVFFLEVRDLDNYTREGDLIVHSDHIAVGYGPSHDLRVIDFAAGDDTNYRRMRAINDLTAIALFYSNRGAEHLRQGELEAAREWLHGAVSIDQTLAPAWVNYGVVLRRLGEIDLAEEVYRKALEIDSGELAAYQNLAAVLRIKGRSEEALELLSLVARSGNRNPYSYVALGDLSQRHGRTEEAERFYRRAMRLGREDAEPIAALGLLELDSGDVLAARKMLKKAQRIEPEQPRVARLAERLSRVAPPGS